MNNILLNKSNQITESIRTTFRKKIWKKFIKAIIDFDLIKDGDKIAVAVSGGKDSLLLAKLFQELKKDKSKNFELIFISMNPGFKNEDLDKFKENIQILGIDCQIFDANVWKIAFEASPENPCFLCSKMRRGILYNKIEELGFTKLALGHHLDDLIETSLINIFYAGTIKTMIPKVLSTSKSLEIIRPLSYIYEKDIISFMTSNELEGMSCGCPVESKELDSKRKEIKTLLTTLEKTNPHIKQSILSSLKNVNLDYILGYTRGNKKDISKN